MAGFLSYQNLNISKSTALIFSNIHIINNTGIIDPYDIIKIKFDNQNFLVNRLIVVYTGHTHTDILH